MLQILSIKRLVLVAALCLPTHSLTAQTYSEPVRGSETRQDTLDAIRPHAQRAFAPPIEFVTGELRVLGTWLL